MFSLFMKNYSLLSVFGSIYADIACNWKCTSAWPMKLAVKYKSHRHNLKTWLVKCTKSPTSIQSEWCFSLHYGSTEIINAPLYSLHEC